MALVQPPPEQQAIFSRLIAAAGEAMAAGCAFADARAPGAAKLLNDYLAQGFVPRLVIETLPVQLIEAALIGNDANGDPIAVEIFRYQAEPTPEGLH